MNYTEVLPVILGHDAPPLEPTDKEISSNILSIIDDGITHLHQKTLESSPGSIPDFSNEIDDLKATIHHHLLELAKEGRKNRYYYDLLTRYAFLSELVYAPIMKMDAFAQLVDGMYSINVHILAEALNEYDHPDTTPYTRDYLRGIINEQTAIALLNRGQDPQRLALPASHIEDTQEKTDVLCHIYRHDRLHSTRVQVKTSPPSSIRAVRPTNGIVVVAARDMANHDLSTSRMIVDELYTPETFTQGEALSQVEFHFMGKINDKMRDISSNT